LLGDGVLALLGLRSGPREAGRQAMNAVIGIAFNIAALNRFLERDLDEPIRFGVGVHAGTAIVGDIGYQDHTLFTAIGDPVNTAARLQDQSKALHCEVVISEEVWRSVGLTEDALPQHEVFVAGREAPIRVRTATNTAQLSAAMNAEAPAAAGVQGATVVTPLPPGTDGVSADRQRHLRSLWSNASPTFVRPPFSA
jgi:adenylate cyclase